MSKRFGLVVFDWDGTLMDSTSAIAASLQAAARDIGVTPPSDERANHIIGLGLFDSLRYALPDLAEARYRELAERYRHHYLSRDHELILFDGIETMLSQLAETGIRLAVATGKARSGLNRVLASTGLGPRFHATRCADECQSKPHPQMLEELMDEFGVTPAATLMIGDTTHDLQMAINAGTAAVGVSYGAHPRETLIATEPLYCAASVPELAQWLQENV